MPSAGENLVSIRNIALVMFVAVVVVVFLCLPTPLMAFVLAWILISIPVGVVVGHCVLSEK